MGAGAGIRTIRRLFNRDVSNKTRRACGDLVSEVYPLLQAVAHRAGASLTLEVQSGLPEVMIDSLRIQHVVLTLCRTRSKRASPAQWCSFGLSVIAMASKSSVLDHGGGIPENDRAQIFKPFYTTKAQGTGSGSHRPGRSSKPMKGRSASRTPRAEAHVSGSGCRAMI